MCKLNHTYTKLQNEFDYHSSLGGYFALITALKCFFFVFFVNGWKNGEKLEPRETICQVSNILIAVQSTSK